jgi:hypothetical protein
MSKISLFNGLPKKGQPHICDEVISLEDFLNGVKFGTWKNIIEPIRQEQNKDKRSALKRNLPTVTVGGVFKERLQDKLLQHSGFICVDIDQFNDKTALIQDRYTYALFRSVSGNGIAVVVKVNPDKHKESYRWLSDYYFTEYGISVDPAPKNVASLRYVSFDTELFLNLRSLKSKTKSDKPKKTKTIPVVLSGSEVAEMINEVTAMKIDIAPDYDSYLKLGFSLANGFGEEGRDFFHSLCQVSDKYNSQQCDKQYDRSLDGANKSGITVGTFYYMMKTAGVEPPKGNEKAVQLAAMAKKTGRTQEAVELQLVQMENLDPAHAKRISEEVFSRPDIDLSAVANDPDKLIESLIGWLQQNHPMRLNTITKVIEENGTEIKEAKINTIYLRARSVFNSKEVTKDLVNTIIFSDMIPEFNPITEYIDKNRNKNSTGNIDAIIKSINTDTKYSDIFIKKWLVSIIAAYDGNPVRTVLALVGGQNTGKTEWFRRLLPDKLKKYYAESKLDAGKDDEILMTQRLIVMDDEMGGKSKQDEKRFKELTSKQIFSLRAPYGRFNEDFKRLSLLCGTSNDPNIINDPTGNTRILPINVLSIDHELYNSIDKNELFMELYRTYQSGYEWQLSKSDLIELGLVSNEFEQIPYERELISQFFMHASNGGFTEYLTSTEIKDFIETNSRQRILSIKRFGIELSNVLGQSEQKKINGVNQKRYKCVRVTGERVTSETQTDKDLPF